MLTYLFVSAGEAFTIDTSLHIGANIIPLPSDDLSIFDGKTNEAYINVNSLLR